MTLDELVAIEGAISPMMEAANNDGDITCALAVADELESRGHQEIADTVRYSRDEYTGQSTTAIYRMHKLGTWMNDQWRQLASPRLERPARAISAHFAQEVSGKEYRRKPPLAIRVPSPGQPFLYVAVRPAWSRNYGRGNGGEVNAAHLYASLVTPFTVEGQGRSASGVELVTVSIETGARFEVRVSSWRRSRSIGNLVRLTQTLEQLLDNAPSLFAMSSRHCAICGKSLTDPVSMGRGIGPECVKQFQRLMARIEAER